PDGSILEGREAIQAVGSVAEEVGADLICALSPSDTHQDHRATGNAAAAAGRRVCRVLFYESPTSVRFQAAMYIDVEDHLEGKLTAIRAHTSQVLKNHLVDPEAVEAQARYHGFRARIRYAEAFETGRFVWELPKRGNQGAGIEHMVHAALEEKR